MKFPSFGAHWLGLAIAAFAAAVILLIVALFALPALAQSKNCQNVYNPMSGKWEYVCVERDPGDHRAPVCRQEYDPMNRVWVTVCE